MASVCGCFGKKPSDHAEPEKKTVRIDDMNLRRNTWSRAGRRCDRGSCLPPQPCWWSRVRPIIWMHAGGAHTPYLSPSPKAVVSGQPRRCPARADYRRAARLAARWQQRFNYATLSWSDCIGSFCTLVRTWSNAEHDLGHCDLFQRRHPTSFVNLR